MTGERWSRCSGWPAENPSFPCVGARGPFRQPEPRTTSVNRSPGRLPSTGAQDHQQDRHYRCHDDHRGHHHQNHNVPFSQAPALSRSVPGSSRGWCDDRGSRHGLPIRGLGGSRVLGPPGRGRRRAPGLGLGGGGGSGARLQAPQVVGQWKGLGPGSAPACGPIPATGLGRRGGGCHGLPELGGDAVRVGRRGRGLPRRSGRFGPRWPAPGWGRGWWWRSRLLLPGWWRWRPGPFFLGRRGRGGPRRLRWRGRRRLWAILPGARGRRLRPGGRRFRGSGPGSGSRPAGGAEEVRVSAVSGLVLFFRGMGIVFRRSCSGPGF